MAILTITHWVRHGEVVNPHHILPGRLPNFHLNKNGIKQASAVGFFLKSKPIKAIYTSPLERCHETAGIIHKQLGKIPIFTMEELNEVITARDGEPLKQVEKDGFNFFKPEYHLKGAETIEEIVQRVKSALEMILHRHRGQEIVVSTHGDLIIFLKMKLLWNRLEFALSRGPQYPRPGSILSLSFNESNTLIQSSEVVFQI